MPTNSYYNPSLLYLKMPFAETQWPVNSLKFFYLQALASDAPYNETHWHSKSWNDLLDKAIARADQGEGAGATGTRCRRSSTSRAATSTGRTPTGSTALSKKVQGLKPSAAGALGNYRFLDAWLSG